MNKFLLILFIFISCKKNNEIEKTFTTQKNEYWNYIDCDYGHSLYFKFYVDSKYDKFMRKPINQSDKGFDLFNRDGDLLSTQRTWSIKNDSIFVWDNEEYKIETCTKDSIILTHYHYEVKNRKCKVTLKKVIDK